MKLPSWGKVNFFGKYQGSSQGKSARLKRITFGIVIVVLLVAALLAVFFRNDLLSLLKNYPVELGRVPGTASPTPYVPISPTPTGTPIPLPPGPGSYSISQAKHSGPTINRVTFDPLDVKKGQKLTVTVEVMAESTITELTATLQTDNGSQQLSFARIEGTDEEGKWESSIKLEDSVLYKYILTIKAVAGGLKSEAVVAPRS